ncbi:MAG: TrmB family transcriptional regulator [Lachnospiraceae bacterium]|nr:TrmB family transcriptional regulator [Lachnospiraceae bacterium]
MDNIDRLVEFGLTRQEATLYISLCTEGELTGYEASKVTGISRSNAYNALASLVEKGAANVVDGSVTKYVPVSFDEFCTGKLHYLEQIREELIQNAPPVKIATESYVTITGDRQIRDKLVWLLLQTKERVYLILTAQWVSYVKDILLDMHRRGIRILLITEPGVKLPGIRTYYARGMDHQLSAIVDDQYVLDGDTGSDYATCLFSGKKELAEVFKDSLRTKIKFFD